MRCRKFAGFVVILFGFLAVQWAERSQAQAPVRSADLARAADGLVAAGELDREEIAAEDAWYDRHELSLGVDGNLPGNLRVFDDNGKLIPARVKLYFLQAGKVVSQSTPNDDGDFQAVGLKPGTFSLVAAGQSGFAALGVRILPPPERPEPPKANTIGRIREVSQPGANAGLHLNISIIPSVDVQPAFGIATAANAGGLGSLPGLTGLGGAAAGPLGTIGGTTAAGALGGGAVGGAAGFGGAGGLFVAGAAAAGIAAGSNNNNNGTSSSSSSTASPNGT
jgi:hypothetical protein